MFHIREYRSPDLSSLAKIYSSSIRHHGPAAYSDKQIEAWADYSESPEFRDWIGDAQTFVAVDEIGECIGFAGLSDISHISSAFVSPAYSRMGVASALLDKLLEIVRTKGIRQVTVHASEFSKPLFEKYGFEVTEIEHTQVKGVDFSRYAMRAQM